MKTTLRDLRAALATVDVGMATYDVLPGGKAQLPALIVGWPTVLDFTDGTLDGSSAAEIPLTVVLALGSDSAHSQGKLDVLVDGELQGALDAIDTPPWRWIHVVRAESFRTVTIGESTPALAVDFIVDLLA